jgi:hypothetical protein
MISKLRSMFQFGGKRSQNNQSNGPMHVGDIYYYNQAKGIQLDIFEKNTIKLGETSRIIIFERAEEFIIMLLERMKMADEGIISVFANPVFQMLVYDAQLVYVKSNDKQFARNLISFLMLRAKQSERNINQLFVEECLSTVAKLSKEQLDGLSIIHLVEKWYMQVNEFNSRIYGTTEGNKFNELKKFLLDFQNSIEPFSILLNGDNLGVIACITDFYIDIIVLLLLRKKTNLYLGYWMIYAINIQSYFAKA